MNSQIATDMGLEERRRVATNPSTPAETLKVLAMDENEWVRGEVAFNPSTPVETLKVLATDKDDDVRQSAKLRRD